jgi:hypothetical protein
VEAGHLDGSPDLEARTQPSHRFAWFVGTLVGKALRSTKLEHAYSLECEFDDEGKHEYEVIV